MAKADTSEWASAVSGIWTNPACWVGGIIPTNTSTYTNDISVNVSGVYTSQWINNLQYVEVGAINVGTTTGSGTQTVQITGYAYQRADVDNSIIVGGYGVLDLKQSLNDLATSSAVSLRVTSGGVLRMSQPDYRTWLTGANRLLIVDAGGWVDIPTNCGWDPGTLSSGVHTNDGVISGAGNINGPSGGSISLAGAGSVTGTGAITIPANGSLSLGGSLTISRNIIPAVSVVGSLYFLPGANLTMNGSIVITNVTRAYWIAVDNTTSVMGGSGLIDIAYNGSSSSFGGRQNSITGTNTLGGTGQLILRTGGNVVDLYFNLFTLSRTGTVSDAGGMFRINSGRNMIVSGAGGYLAMNPGTTLYFGRLNSWDSYSSHLCVRSGASLSLSGAQVLGYRSASDPYALYFSDDNTAANLSLASGTTNSMTGLATNQTLSVRLGTNAAVSVGAGSILTLSNAVLSVTMTNSALWGWASQGTLGVGTNVQMEALSLDHGNHVTIANEPFSIKDLAFTADNSTLVLTNSVGTTKRALYVKTLDLSALSPGATVDLQGFSGAERVYYSTLINPHGVTFITPAEWIQIPAEGTMVIIL